MPGGGKITVKLDIIDKFVEVNITDTGPGIPEEIRNQLFQPFFSTKSSSLGLGLSFCKLAIESNRESIGIYSVVREGTTVSVRLPLYPFDGVITLKPPDISDKIAQAKDKLEGVRQ